MQAAGFDLVIFDLDGVLVDSEVLSLECLSALLGEHGLPTPIDVVMARYLGRPSAYVRADFEARTGRPLSLAFSKTHRDRLVARFRTELRPMPGALQILSSLTTPSCLASSSDPERIDAALAITGLRPYLAGRIFHAGMVARGKPAPDLFLHAAGEMRADPSRCLVIEDSESGVVAGKAAGMTVCGFVGGSHLQGFDAASALVPAGADFIAARLGEVFPPAPGRQAFTGTHFR